LTTLDAAAGETAHRFPVFLPDGRHFLYAAIRPGVGQLNVLVGSLDSAARQPLLSSVLSGATYAEGYVWFNRMNSLFVQRFDPKALRLSGEPTAFGEATWTSGSWAGRPPVSLSAAGSLAYLGLESVSQKNRLAWFDRSGKESGHIQTPPDRFVKVALAPDGRHAALERAASAGPGTGEVWTVDLERGATSRFASGGRPFWSPDGSHIVFIGGQRDATNRIVSKSVDGTPTESPSSARRGP
jgi:hypothetical protein